MKIIIAIILLSFNVTFLQAHQQKVIKLKPAKERMQLRDYFIAGVVDDRPDTSNVGSLRNGLSKTMTAVNLEEGARASASAYIRQFVTGADQKEGITLHIVRWEIGERTEKGKRVAELSSHFAFYRNEDKLMEYTGNAYVRSVIDVSSHVAALFSQSLESVLKEFDGWWRNNRAAYLDAQVVGLEVTAVLKTAAKNKDLIVFNPKMPLTIADFKGKPDELSEYEAFTYSGFNMEYESQTTGKRTKVKISVSPFFDKSKSWIRPKARNDYVLMHEQLHFDVTAMKAMEFVQAINKYSFSLDNYQEELNQLHRQYDKDADALQEQYDKETKHGTLEGKQSQWKMEIKQRLSKVVAAGS